MLRIVTYNIQFSRGRDQRYDLARVADAVRDADIIALQEVERFWDRSGNTDQPMLLGELLPHHYWVYGPSIDVLKQFGPDPVGAARRQFGNMVLARFPILSSRNHLLPRTAFLPIRSIQRAAIETVVQLADGRLIRVTSTHLDHLSTSLRIEQCQTLVNMHRSSPLEGNVEHGPASAPLWQEALHPPVPPADHIVLGDFNMEPSSPEYDVMVGDLHPRHGRLNRLDGFADAWVLAGNDEEAGASFYLDATKRLGIRIDYGFVSAGLVPAVRRTWIDEDAVGSDHQPCWTELDL